MTPLHGGIGKRHGRLNTLAHPQNSRPVDARLALANGAAHPGETMTQQLAARFSPRKNYLLKNELTMLAIIAANRWQRPICFTNAAEIQPAGSKICPATAASLTNLTRRK